MGDIRFMLILSICLHFQLGATNGIFFPPFFRSFHPGPPPLNVDQGNANEVHQTAPFPFHFSVFRYISPFLRNFDEGIEATDNKTDSAETPHKSIFNYSLHDKVNEVSGKVENEKLNAIIPQHHISKKVISSNYERTEKTSLGRNDLISKLHQRHFPFKKSENSYRNREKDIQYLKQNVTQQDITDDPLMVTENCTVRLFVSRYFYISINWTSLIIHFVVILLISTLLTFGLLSCQQCCSSEQRSHLSKIKPLYI